MKRGTWEITYAILNMVEQTSVKFKIMCGANLTSWTLRDYVHYLKERGLVTVEQQGRNERIYITREGKTLLELLRQVAGILNGRRRTNLR